MSQNPNDPNYNPYGQNPSNPNYPGMPGTAYGGPSQPPSGPNPGYNPYPSPNPPSGPNPNQNTPNSSYGSYGNPNPYAPPPPPGPNPYGNQPTPMPMEPNPYDPYAQTAMSQNPVSNPGYPPSNPGYPPSNPGYPNPMSNPGYPMTNPQAGMMPTTPPQPLPPIIPQKRGSGMTILISVIVLLVVVGGSVFGLITYNNGQQTMHANATAAAQTQVSGNITATAQAQATVSAVANTYPFSNKVLLNDPMVDNSKGIKWDTNHTSSGSCGFSGSAYHVIETDSRYYNTCAALGSNYSDFTFEAEMVIKSGGDGSGSTAAAGGGFLFRADENNNKFYRLSIDATGFYYILVSVDSTGTSGNARKLKEGTASSFSTGLGQTNTLAIVARGNQYSFYVNQQLVTSFTDSTYTHGQIGFDVDYGTSTSELVFTNVKVWQL